MDHIKNSCKGVIECAAWARPADTRMSVLI